MKNQFQKLNDLELGWLIGILEGEGYFGYEKWSFRVQVKMTDFDTIERVASMFARVTGHIPSIHESPNKNTLDSMPYVVSIHGNDAKQVMLLIVKHMSYRRRTKIWQSLHKFKPATKMTATNIIDLCTKAKLNG